MILCVSIRFFIVNLIPIDEQIMTADSRQQHEFLQNPFSWQDMATSSYRPHTLTVPPPNDKQGQRRSE